MIINTTGQTIVGGVKNGFLMGVPYDDGLGEGGENPAWEGDDFRGGSTVGNELRKWGGPKGD